MAIYNVKNDNKIGCSSILVNKDGTTLKDYIGTESIVKGSGTEFNLSNCLNKKLKDFKGYGNAKQDSLTGKNLFVNNFTSQTVNGVTITKNVDGSLTLNGTHNSSNTTDVYSLGTSQQYPNFSLEDGQYILSSTNTDDVLLLAVLKDSNDANTILTAGINTFSGMVSNIVGARLFIRIQPNKTFNNLKIYPQLEKGTVPTSYEPYCGGIPAPNPEYPIDYYGVTGRQVVKFNSKNLLEIIDGTASLNGMSLTRKNGVMIFDGTNTNQYQGQYISMNLTLTEKMTFSLNNESSINNAIKFFCSYRSNGSTNNSYINISGGKTFNIGDKINQFYIIVDANTTVDNYIIKPQLEPGTISSSYTPYQQEEYEINLDNIKLYENEYIYKSNNNWYIHRLWNEVTLDGSENWIGYTSSNGYARIGFNYSNIALNPNSNLILAISNMFSGVSTQYLLDNIGNYISSMRADNQGIFVKINEEILSSANVSGFKTWLSSNNVKVLYQLATPIEEQITNEELINQLNAIQPLLGDNIITVNSNNELVMNVDIEAYTNTQKGINQYLLDNI